MADRKECAFYEGCIYREEFGFCAHYCMKYRSEEGEVEDGNWG